MAQRNHLLAAALFTLLFISEAMHLCPPLKAAKRELKSRTQGLLHDLQKEAICAYDVPLSGNITQCLTKLKKNNSDCELASIYGTYVTEANKFDIHTLVTEGLPPINQHLYHIQDYLCKTKSAVQDCGEAFEDSDRDYEKICKVKSLLQHLIQWLSKEHC